MRDYNIVWKLRMAPIPFLFALTVLFLANFLAGQFTEIQWLKESQKFFNIVNRISDALVWCYSANSKTTGIFVSKDGWIITAGHKVDLDFPESDEIHVKLERTRNATVFKSQKIISPKPDLDLLLFKINYKPKYYFKKFKKPYLFEESWALGFRGHLGKCVSSPGYVTVYLPRLNLLASTVRIESGNSGSVLINREGEALGIVVLRTADTKDALFIPGHIVEEFIKSELKND